MEGRIARIGDPRFVRRVGVPTLGRPSWEAIMALRSESPLIILASAIFLCSSLVNNEIHRLTVFAAGR